MNQVVEGGEEGRAAADLQAKELVVRLVDFLKDYDAQKYPPVTDIGTYDLFATRGEDVPDVPAVDLTGGAGTWLTVHFVELPAPPLVPEDLNAYVPASRNLSPTVRPQPRIPLEETPDPTEDDPDPQPSDESRRRLAMAEAWVDEHWMQWSTAWQQAQLGKQFYRRLFEQLQLIENDRESYELVWGFGRLRWRCDGITVNHPLFTVPVEIEQGKNNELVLLPSGALEVETLPFANLPVADRAALGRVRQAVSTEPFDPWSSDVLLAETRSVIRALHHDAVVVGEGEQRQDAPVTDTGWVLFTRRRRPDRQGFLDSMRELYAGGVVPPDALSSIVINAPSAYAASDQDENSEGAEREASPAEVEPLLLPLPSNEEQQRILLLAQQQSGVIVQGPPGTGKSHTIANLVSHYVAYGHRVLVVAEKEQALSVLAEKIPEEIRELAVSVLGSDQTSRKALETTIGSIQARVSTLDKRTADRQIAALTSDLRQMDAEIAQTTDRLLAARRSETGSLPGTWTAGDSPSPQQAAAWVAEHEARLNFIPDRITVDVPLPITADELVELKQLLRSIGLERARHSALVLPALPELPTAAQLVDLFGRRDHLRAGLQTAAPEIDDWALIDGTTAEFLDQIRVELIAEQTQTHTAQQPWLSQIVGQLTDLLLRGLWEQLCDATRADRERIVALRPQLAAHHVEIPAAPDPMFATHLEAARQRLAERGKLGMFAGDLKRALEACRVDGRAPQTVDAIALCQQQLHVANLRRTLCVRWFNQVSTVGGPELDPARPEDMVGQLLQQIVDVLDAPMRWAQLLAKLSELGIEPRGEYSPEVVGRLIEVLDVARSRPLERRLSAELRQIEAYLDHGMRGRDASPLWALLSDSLRAETPHTWEEHRLAVSDLFGIADDARRLTELAGRLRMAAPVWADKVFAAPDAAGDPSVLGEAWQWRQLNTWVEDVMGGDSPAALQGHLERLGVARRRLVTELVGVRAWRRLADNLGDRQRQALNSYLAATKRYGKTGGKFAARWLAAIRDALNESKDAVPVWIMTTARALSSFRPDARVPFDVIIVDEASQIGIDAVPLFALARRAIVVGDDKQTSPSAVGMDQQKVFDLIDSHLSAVRHHRVLFNPTNSLYDLAFQKFPRSVMLREHFRCLPEIIAFSNQQFYGNKIEPLRENRPAPDWPALGTVKVVDGYRSAKDTNEAEANVVADLVAEMVEDPACDGMDFGVVTLLSGGQSDFIRTKLFDRLGPQVMTERRLRVGDAANFQGDERNVMLVSTVVATDPTNPTGRLGAMTGKDAEQRINVAASRARDRMIVVHSVDPERFPSGDHRASLIRHCRNPVAQDVELQDQLDRCDSEFERMVLRRIVARGYARVRSQVHVGADSHNFRIDLVVDGPQSRLAVECDGERWHGEERWHADRARQEVLERAGWTFSRIRGSTFFRDPDAALEPLWQRLEELGIPTGSAWLDGPSHVSTVVERRGIPPEPVLELEPPPTAGSVGSLTDATGSPDRTHSTDRVETSRTGNNQLLLASDVAAEALDDAAADTAAPAAEESIDGLLPHRTEPPQPSSHGLTAMGPVRPNLTGSSPPAPEVRTVQKDSGLAPYRRFDGGPFPPVASERTREIAAGIWEIVAAEGPILALRAYRLYVAASGGQRVGSEIKRSLNKVVHRELSARRLASIPDDVVGIVDRTLFLPGTAPVVLRELGPRDLVEVPQSEICELIEQLGLTGQTGERLHRAVLSAYGLSRLTGRATAFLTACERYRWRSDE